MKLRSAGVGCRLWKFYFYYYFLRWEELTAYLYTNGNDRIEGEILMIQVREDNPRIMSLRRGDENWSIGRRFYFM